MAREWYATCKDCGAEYGYSDSSHQLSSRRGLSRPERCPKCRMLHSREISTLGLSHFDLAPIKPIPPTGLKPGRLGGLIREKRVHELRPKETDFDFGKFGIQDGHIREYFDLMQRNQVTVVVAPTGAGKSTFLPYRLMVPPEPLPEDLWTRHGQIVITQPRIQATRNIPAFVARDLHGSSLGAGFDVGFRHSGSPATDWRNKLVYMTDGTLINMIVRNELGRLSVIMIDEAHERSVNIDLILGLLKTQLPRYPHLKLIIASATIDTELFVNYYGGPERVALYEFPGKRKYPVEDRYRQSDSIPYTQFAGRMPEEVAHKAFEILRAMQTGDNPELLTMTIQDAPQAPVKGDILAFLHGQKPIEHAVATLRDLIDQEPRLSGKVDVLPLFTKLPQKEQDRALKPKQDPNRWRVVISTNVAETSLTVEGIVHVIETGLINESQWDPQTQTTFVVPKQHSQSGCKQRWGRAGRVQPGIAHCLYTREQFEQFPEHTDPEIVRAPIDQIVLTAKAAGVNDIADFDWIQPPSEAELARAPHYLRQIGALDADGDLTEHGLELRGIPEEIDVANLMILADRFACTVEMATLIPMLKLGGYRALLHWERSWDAPTKRTVHRIHQALMAPCQDDVEFFLKVWAAWEGSGQGKRRARWARRHFVNHELLKQVMDERASLLGMLSSHKKDDKARPIDFRLLTRLRLVLTYGLSTQIYHLVEVTQADNGQGVERVYQPYLSDSQASEAVRALHEGATVEISPESICFDRLPDYFVCGGRQRMRFRESPQKDPETKISASFLTLLKPEWLGIIGQPPIAVARTIAASTRTDNGDLIPTTTHARLFIDQGYPVGAQYVCRSAGSGGLVHLGARHKGPTPLRTTSSYEEVEAGEQVEVLDRETELDASAGIDEAELARATVLEEDEDLSLWAEIDSQSAEAEELEDALETTEAEDADSPTANGASPMQMVGRIVNRSDQVTIPSARSFVATIVGHDLSNPGQPAVLLEMVIQPDPFEQFVRRYKVGDDIEVEVIGVERYISDWLMYLVVREMETQLEIVLDPYDASIIARNFAIEVLQEAPAGTRLTVTVDDINRKARSVRVTRLKASEAATLRLLGREKERIVDALVADVREQGLYLWLDWEHTLDYAPVGAYVPLSRLLQRPDEMSLGQVCRVKVAAKDWKNPFRRQVDSVGDKLSAQLEKMHFSSDLSWDASTRTFAIQGRMSYDQRQKLLHLSPNPQYRRVVNILFRRSNELYTRLLDVTGVENVAPLVGSSTQAKVVQVTDDFVDLELEGGLREGVPKYKAIYDRNQDLHESFQEGNTVEVWVKGVEVDRVEADLSLLDPTQDPLNAFEPGQALEGRVTNVFEDRAYVELTPGVEGMIHVSEVAWYHVVKATDALRGDQKVRVRILDIDREKRQTSLTMRLPETDPLRRYRVGQRLLGRVVRFTSEGKGAIIELVPGAEGFLYKDEIGMDPVNDAREALEEGQELRVRISALDYEGRRMRVTARGLYDQELFVPSSHAGLVIGKGGEVIKEIMRQTRTHVDLEDDGYCLVQGLRQEHVNAGARRIQEIVASRIVTFDLPGALVGRLIGKGGQTIQSIQRSTGARIDTEKGSSRVTVTAASDQVLQRTLQQIHDVLASHEATIAVPTSMIGRIVGRGGTTIKSIRDQTGTRIDISRDNSGRIVVSGKSASQVDQAIRFIHAQAGSANVLSRRDISLPPWTEVRSQPPATFKSRERRGLEQMEFEPTMPPPPKPVIAKARPGEQLEQQQVYQESLQVTSAQLGMLRRREGGLLKALFGGAKSPLDKVRDSTGARIVADSVTCTLRISSRSAQATQRAVAEIRRLL